MRWFPPGILRFAEMKVANVIPSLRGIRTYSAGQAEVQIPCKLGMTTSVAASFVVQGRRSRWATQDDMGPDDVWPGDIW